MFQFLRKLLSGWFNRLPTRISLNKQDADIERFFTDNEYPLRVFDELVSTTPPFKRILVIYGIGSVGKSTLLIMYHLFCLRHQIAIGIARGEETRSAMDVLSSWANDLKGNDISLPTFQKSMSHYLMLQSEVENTVKEMSPAAKVGKQAAGSVVRAAASIIPIPIVNSLVGELGASAVEAISNRIQSTLSGPDLEFFLDPTERVTNDFLNDLSQAATRHHIVLMIDTFEQMTKLDDWVRKLTKRLPESVLIVIAGREIPQWDRDWPEWMGQAKTLELKEMKPDDLRTLVQRYYTYIHGEGIPDPNQVEAVVQFARGLPLVATTVVRLWVKHGVEDFQSVQSQVVLDLVDRLLEGVPQDMRPAFEVAAVLRYFNIDVLQALLNRSDADELFSKLRRWPFIRPRSEGLAVHETMREMMNKALYMNKPDYFHDLHRKAAAFYEKRLMDARGEERERYILERLYHGILGDEKSGIQLFQETAEELVVYHLIVRLRAILKDVETYKQELVDESSKQWVKYYGARLCHLEGKWEEEEEQIYQEIEKEQVEPKLHAYVFCDYGELLSSLEWRKKPGSPQKAVELIQRAFNLVPPDRKLVSGHKSLSIIYEYQGDMVLAEQHLNDMLQFYQEQGNAIGVAEVCFDLRWHYMLRGNWKMMLDSHNEGVKNIKPYLDISPILREKALRVNWGHIWMGRYKEFVDNFREMVEDVLPQMADPYIMSERLCWLAYGEGMRRMFNEAQKHFNEAFTIRREMGLEGRKDFQGPFRGFWGAIYTKQGEFVKAENPDEFVKAEQNLGIALTIKREVQDTLGIPEVLIWLGELYEIQKIWDKAEDCYRQCLEDYKVGRPYFDSWALTNMVRVKYSQYQYDSIPSFFNQAEELAQQNEYNDHLASLYLTQGHVVWDDHIPDWESGFEAALRCYQHALIYALRYNRFLLDEALQGNVHTAFQPIIPHCLEKGEEGHRMLATLREWWKKGNNDIGTPRPDSISPIPERISLLAAETMARQQFEPGNGILQRSVIEQLQGL